VLVQHHLPDQLPPLGSFPPSPPSAPSSYFSPSNPIRLLSAKVHSYGLYSLTPLF
jgi:hypothetical protein